LSQISSEEFLLIGKVVRPHGLKGLLRIQSYAVSEASFYAAGSVWIRTQKGLAHKFTVVSVNKHKNALVLGLDGIDSRDKAEQYPGGEIFIKKASIPLDEDEYLWKDLLGLKVYLETGDYLGNITRIIPTSSNDIYLVKEGAREFYVPAVHDVVKEIDLKNGKMIILSLEGLLDVNEV
jgi:16S rRNA processing protein RimM